jgi:hypothetical protein
VQRFQQAFGTSTYEIKEWLWAVFAQDSIAVSRALSLSLGLRYERQTFTDDTNNLAPRVGIVFRPGGDPKTALRAGYGIYYSELRANSAAGYSLNGPEGVFTFSVAPGQLGFPSTLGPLPAFPPGAVLPARDITVRAGQRDFVSRFVDVSRLRGYPDALVNPRTDLFTAGVERDLGGRWIAGADYVHQHIRDIDRTLDLNPPAPFDRTQPGQLRSAAAADLTRPIVPQANGYRRVLVLMNEGVADYDALQLNVSRRGQRFSMLVSYTLSKSTNTVEPDAPGGQDPNDSTQLGETERAESVLSQRHRGVLSGFVRGPADVLFGAVVTVASGRPYNITTGIDNNGDGNNTDRPVLNGRVIGRNEGHGSAVYQADAFLEREFRLGGRARIAGRVEGFNIFNHGNIVGRNGVYGNDPSGTPSPTLGAPVGGIAGVDPSRSVQLSAKVRF